MTCIGKNVERIGARDLVMGRTLFSDDIKFNEELVIGIVRSRIHHGEILRIDISEAQRVPGVVGVLIASDIPGKNSHGMIIPDQPLLAKDRVRFKGEAVAIVAAVDRINLKSGMDKVQTGYRELPSVLTAESALEDSAVSVHEGSNILFKENIRKGDVEFGFLKSDLVIERTYRTGHIEHNYLEPDAGVGYLDADGNYVIHCSTQNPHADQEAVAEILGLDTSRVRIIQAATGGGFGSKLDLTVQGYIALTLYHFKKPTRLVYTREEVYQSTSKRHPAKIVMKTGAAKDGRIIALKARILFDTGAYASAGMAVAVRSAVHASGPYEVENADVESMAVYTNNPVSGAMRGFGVPQTAFAHESQMDIIASELGIDPFAIRMKNALKPKSRTITGQTLGESVGILKCLDVIQPHYKRELVQWKAKKLLKGKMRGVGIGAMWYGIGNTGVKNPSNAKLELSLDGSVILYIGAADIGQGSTTVLAQIAASVLGIEITEIQLVVADTMLTPLAGHTSASRQTYITGNAVKAAAMGLADTIIGEAEKALDTPREMLNLRAGFVENKEIPGIRVQLSEIAARLSKNGSSLTWKARFDPDVTPLEDASGQGAPYATYAFACQLALVEVDTETGEVFVSKVIAAHDVGKAINPRNVEAQIHGGVAMGIGFALTEQFVPGKTISMGDCYLPTSLNTPNIEALIVEVQEPSGPFGAKGVGEPSVIPTAPAILNAIADALQVRIFALPANCEKVWAIYNKSAER